MTSLQYKYPPPEIWDQILSEATYYPGEFDANEWVGGNELDLARRDITSNTTSNRFILYNRMQGDIKTKFASQMDTRRSLILVCREWYNLAIRHFYGSVTVQGAGIRKLANSVVANKSLGRLVKRLEWKWAHQNWISDLVLVLSKCPNIVVFYEIPANFGGTALPWWHFVMSNPANSAKLRYGGGDSARVPDMRFFTFVSSHSSLVALKLPSPSSYVSPSAPISRTPLSLPNLRILDFGGVSNIENRPLLSYICTWDLPELCTVWVPVNLTRVLPLGEFWKKHGEKLTTIRIYSSMLSASGLLLNNVSLGIDSIPQPPSEIFPRLRQLIIYSSMGDYAPLFLPSMSLEIYEVSYYGTAPSHESRDRPLHHIVGYHMQRLPADRAPNLRTFRVSDCPRKGDHRPWKEHDGYVKVYNEVTKTRLKARGVTLEILELE